MWERGARVVVNSGDEGKRITDSASSLLERLHKSHSQLGESISVKELAWKGLLIGTTFGTAFQVTHNNGNLPVRYTYCISTQKLALPHAAVLGGVTPNERGSGTFC